MRLLSLLGHELLGGPRVKVETTGRFTPVAALGEEGNAVLRRGIIDEFSSAVEMAREFGCMCQCRRQSRLAATNGKLLPACFFTAEPDRRWEGCQDT